MDDSGPVWSAVLERFERHAPASVEVDPFWILLAKSSGCGWGGHEADKGGLAGSFAWRACEPVADAAKVYGSSGEHMLQVGFSQPYVARPAQVQGAGAQ